MASRSKLDFFRKPLRALLKIFKGKDTQNEDEARETHGSTKATHENPENESTGITKNRADIISSSEVTELDGVAYEVHEGDGNSKGLPKRSLISRVRSLFTRDKGEGEDIPADAKGIGRSLGDGAPTKSSAKSSIFKRLFTRDKGEGEDIPVNAEDRQHSVGGEAPTESSAKSSNVFKRFFTRFFTRDKGKGEDITVDAEDREHSLGNKASTMFSAEFSAQPSSMSDTSVSDIDEDNDLKAKSKIAAFFKELLNTITFPFRFIGNQIGNQVEKIRSRRKARYQDLEEESILKTQLDSETASTHDLDTTAAGMKPPMEINNEKEGEKFEQRDFVASQRNDTDAATDAMMGVRTVAVDTVDANRGSAYTHTVNLDPKEHEEIQDLASRLKHLASHNHSTTADTDPPVETGSKKGSGESEQHDFVASQRNDTDAATDAMMGVRTVNVKVPVPAPRAVKANVQAPNATESSIDSSHPASPNNNVSSETNKNKKMDAVDVMMKGQKDLSTLVQGEIEELKSSAPKYGNDLHTIKGDESLASSPSDFNTVKVKGKTAEQEELQSVNMETSTEETLLSIGDMNEETQENIMLTPTPEEETLKTDAHLPKASDKETQDLERKIVKEAESKAAITSAQSVGHDIRTINKEIKRYPELRHTITTAFIDYIELGQAQHALEELARAEYLARNEESTNKVKGIVENIDEIKKQISEKEKKLKAWTLQVSGTVTNQLVYCKSAKESVTQLIDKLKKNGNLEQSSNELKCLQSRVTEIENLEGRIIEEHKKTTLSAIALGFLNEQYQLKSTLEAQKSTENERDLKDIESKIEALYKSGLIESLDHRLRMRNTRMVKLISIKDDTFAQKNATLIENFVINLGFLQDYLAKGDISPERFENEFDLLYAEASATKEIFNLLSNHQYSSPEPRTHNLLEFRRQQIESWAESEEALLNAIKGGKYYTIATENQPSTTASKLRGALEEVRSRALNLGHTLTTLTTTLTNKLSKSDPNLYQENLSKIKEKITDERRKILSKLNEIEEQLTNRIIIFEKVDDIPAFLRTKGFIAFDINMAKQEIKIINNNIKKLSSDEAVLQKQFSKLAQTIMGSGKDIAQLKLDQSSLAERIRQAKIRINEINNQIKQRDAHNNKLIQQKQKQNKSKNEIANDHIKNIEDVIAHLKETKPQRDKSIFSTQSVGEKRQALLGILDNEINRLEYAKKLIRSEIKNVKDEEISSKAISAINYIDSMISTLEKKKEDINAEIAREIENFKPVSFAISDDDEELKLANPTHDTISKPIMTKRQLNKPLYNTPYQEEFSKSIMQLDMSIADAQTAVKEYNEIVNKDGEELTFEELTSENNLQKLAKARDAIEEAIKNTYASLRSIDKISQQIAPKGKEALTLESGHYLLERSTFIDMSLKEIESLRGNVVSLMAWLSGKNFDIADKKQKILQGSETQLENNEINLSETSETVVDFGNNTDNLIGQISFVKRQLDLQTLIDEYQKMLKTESQWRTVFFDGKQEDVIDFLQNENYDASRQYTIKDIFKASVMMQRSDALAAKFDNLANETSIRIEEVYDDIASLEKQVEDLKRSAASDDHSDNKLEDLYNDQAFQALKSNLAQLEEERKDLYAINEYSTRCSEISIIKDTRDKMEEMLGQMQAQYFSQGTNALQSIGYNELISKPGAIGEKYSGFRNSKGQKLTEDQYSTVVFGELNNILKKVSYALTVNGSYNVNGEFYEQCKSLNEEITASIEKDQKSLSYMDTHHLRGELKKLKDIRSEVKKVIIDHITQETATFTHYNPSSQFFENFIDQAYTAFCKRESHYGMNNIDKRIIELETKLQNAQEQFYTVLGNEEAEVDYAYGVEKSLNKDFADLLAKKLIEESRKDNDMDQDACGRKALLDMHQIKDHLAHSKEVDPEEMDFEEMDDIDIIDKDLYRDAIKKFKDKLDEKDKFDKQLKLKLLNRAKLNALEGSSMDGKTSLDNPQELLKDIEQEINNLQKCLITTPKDAREAKYSDILNQLNEDAKYIIGQWEQREQSLLDTQRQSTSQSENSDTQEIEQWKNIFAILKQTSREYAKPNAMPKTHEEISKKVLDIACEYEALKANFLKEEEKFLKKEEGEEEEFIQGGENPEEEKAKKFALSAERIEKKVKEIHESIEKAKLLRTDSESSYEHYIKILGKLSTSRITENAFIKNVVTKNKNMKIADAQRIRGSLEELYKECKTIAISIPVTTIQTNKTTDGKEIYEAQKLKDHALQKVQQLERIENIAKEKVELLTLLEESLSIDNGNKKDPTLLLSLITEEHYKAKKNLDLLSTEYEIKLSSYQGSFKNSIQDRLNAIYESIEYIREANYPSGIEDFKIAEALNTALILKGNITQTIEDIDNTLSFNALELNKLDEDIANKYVSLAAIGESDSINRNKILLVIKDLIYKRESNIGSSAGYAEIRNELLNAGNDLDPIRQKLQTEFNVILHAHDVNHGIATYARLINDNGKNLPSIEQIKHIENNNEKLIAEIRSAKVKTDATSKEAVERQTIDQIKLISNLFNKITNSCINDYELYRKPCLARRNIITNMQNNFVFSKEKDPEFEKICNEFIRSGESQMTNVMARAFSTKVRDYYSPTIIALARSAEELNNALSSRVAKGMAKDQKQSLVTMIDYCNSLQASLFNAAFVSKEFLNLTHNIGGRLDPRLFKHLVDNSYELESPRVAYEQHQQQANAQPHNSYGLESPRVAYEQHQQQANASQDSALTERTVLSSVRSSQGNEEVGAEGFESRFDDFVDMGDGDINFQNQDQEENMEEDIIQPDVDSHAEGNRNHNEVSELPGNDAPAGQHSHSNSSLNLKATTAEDTGQLNVDSYKKGNRHSKLRFSNFLQDKEISARVAATQKANDDILAKYNAEKNKALPSPNEGQLPVDGEYDRGYQHQQQVEFASHKDGSPEFVDHDGDSLERKLLDTEASADHVEYSHSRSSVSSNATTAEGQLHVNSYEKNHRDYDAVSEFDPIKKLSTSGASTDSTKHSHSSDLLFPKAATAEDKDQSNVYSYAEGNGDHYEVSELLDTEASTDSTKHSHSSDSLPLKATTEGQLHVGDMGNGDSNSQEQDQEEDMEEGISQQDVNSYEEGDRGDKYPQVFGAGLKDNSLVSGDGDDAGFSVSSEASAAGSIKRNHYSNSLNSSVTMEGQLNVDENGNIRNQYPQEFASNEDNSSEFDDGDNVSPVRKLPTTEASADHVKYSHSRSSVSSNATTAEGQLHVDGMGHRYYPYGYYYEVPKFDSHKDDSLVSGDGDDGDSTVSSEASATGSIKRINSRSSLNSSVTMEGQLHVGDMGNGDSNSQEQDQEEDMEEGISQQDVYSYAEGNGDHYEVSELLDTEASTDSTKHSHSNDPLPLTATTAKDTGQLHVGDMGDDDSNLQEQNQEEDTAEDISQQDVNSYEGDDRGDKYPQVFGAGLKDNSLVSGDGDDAGFSVSSGASATGSIKRINSRSSLNSSVTMEDRLHGDEEYDRDYGEVPKFDSHKDDSLVFDDDDDVSTVRKLFTSGASATGSIKRINSRSSLNSSVTMEDRLHGDEEYDRDYGEVSEFDSLKDDSSLFVNDDGDSTVSSGASATGSIKRINSRSSLNSSVTMKGQLHGDEKGHRDSDEESEFGGNHNDDSLVFDDDDDVFPVRKSPTSEALADRVKHSHSRSSVSSNATMEEAEDKDQSNVYSYEGNDRGGQYQQVFGGGLKDNSLVSEWLENIDRPEGEENPGSSGNPHTKKNETSKSIKVSETNEGLNEKINLLFDGYDFVDLNKLSKSALKSLNDDSDASISDYQDVAKDILEKIEEAKYAQVELSAIVEDHNLELQEAIEKLSAEMEKKDHKNNDALNLLRQDVRNKQEDQVGLQRLKNGLDELIADAYNTHEEIQNEVQQTFVNILLSRAQKRKENYAESVEKLDKEITPLENYLKHYQNEYISLEKELDQRTPQEYQSLFESKIAALDSEDTFTSELGDIFINQGSTKDNFIKLGSTYAYMKAKMQKEQGYIRETIKSLKEKILNTGLDRHKEFERLAKMQAKLLKLNEQKEESIKKGESLSTRLLGQIELLETDIKAKAKDLYNGIRSVQQNVMRDFIDPNDKKSEPIFQIMETIVSGLSEDNILHVPASEVMSMLKRLSDNLENDLLPALEEKMHTHEEIFNNDAMQIGGYLDSIYDSNPELHSEIRNSLKYFFRADKNYLLTQNELSKQKMELCRLCVRCYGQKVRDLKALRVFPRGEELLYNTALDDILSHKESLNVMASNTEYAFNQEELESLITQKQEKIDNEITEKNSFLVEKSTEKEKLENELEELLSEIDQIKGKMPLYADGGKKLIEDPNYTEHYICLFLKDVLDYRARLQNACDISERNRAIAIAAGAIDETVKQFHAEESQVVIDIDFFETAKQQLEEPLKEAQGTLEEAQKELENLIKEQAKERLVNGEKTHAYITNDSAISYYYDTHIPNLMSNVEKAKQEIATLEEQHKINLEEYKERFTKCAEKLVREGGFNSDEVGHHLALIKTKIKSHFDTKNSLTGLYDVFIYGKVKDYLDHKSSAKLMSEHVSLDKSDSLLDLDLDPNNTVTPSDISKVMAHLEIIPTKDTVISPKDFLESEKTQFFLQELIKEAMDKDNEYRDRTSYLEDRIGSLTKVIKETTEEVNSKTMLRCDYENTKDFIGHKLYTDEAEMSNLFVLDLDANPSVVTVPDEAFVPDLQEQTTHQDDLYEEDDIYYDGEWGDVHTGNVTRVLEVSELNKTAVKQGGKSDKVSDSTGEYEDAVSELNIEDTVADLNIEDTVTNLSRSPSITSLASSVSSKQGMSGKGVGK